MSRVSYGLIHRKTGVVFGEDELTVMTFGSPREAERMRLGLPSGHSGTEYDVIELPDHNVIPRGHACLMESNPKGPFCIRAIDPGMSNDYYVSKNSEIGMIFRDLFGDAAFRFPDEISALRWIEGMVNPSFRNSFRVERFEPAPKSSFSQEAILKDHSRLLRERTRLIAANRSIDFEMESDKLEFSHSYGKIQEEHFALTNRVREIYRICFGKTPGPDVSALEAAYDVRSFVKEEIGIIALRDNKNESITFVESPSEDEATKI